MKLAPTYQILTVATGLAATAIGITALQAISLPSVTSITPQQLIAKGDTLALAKQLQGKPVIVDIYASWCPGCKNIAPTLAQLKQEYGNKAHFVMFDVSDRQKTEASMKMAAKLGLTKFFTANKSQTATVAIIDPASGKVTKQFRNNPNLAEYTSILDRSIAQMGKGNAMSHGDAMNHGNMMNHGDAMSHGDAMKKP
jgi:thiol-disulfide isomerase/thioredoxin